MRSRKPNSYNEIPSSRNSPENLKIKRSRKFIIRSCFAASITTSSVRFRCSLSFFPRNLSLLPIKWLENVDRPPLFLLIWIVWQLYWTISNNSERENGDRTLREKFIRWGRKRDRSRWEIFIRFIVLFFMLWDFFVSEISGTSFLLNVLYDSQDNILVQSSSDIGHQNRLYLLK